MSPALPVVPFPDIEQATTTYLRTVLPAGTHVGSEWPDPVEAALEAGVVAVSRGGGAWQQRFVTEDVTVDIDILAATKEQAQALAQLVRAHLHAAEGTTQGTARIYGVTDTSLVWLPYQPSAETDTIPRYVLVADMVVRPA